MSVLAAYTVSRWMTDWAPLPEGVRDLLRWLVAILTARVFYLLLTEKE